jgi:hypothetical protein
VWEANRSWLNPVHWDRETDQVTVALQSWLLRSAGRTIVVDTGLGSATRPQHRRPRRVDEPILRAGQAQVWDDSHTIDENLRLSLAPGHGVLILESGGDRAVFAGDMLHTPVQVLAPGMSSCFCHDPAAAERSRPRVLGGPPITPRSWSLRTSQARARWRSTGTARATPCDAGPRSPPEVRQETRSMITTGISRSVLAW